MTRVSHRGRGIARSLMIEAERIAVERGRTLLVLDTATTAARLAFMRASAIIGSASFLDTR